MSGRIVIQNSPMQPAGLTMIRRASLAPFATGPAANAFSPADSALVVALPPFFLTTVSLTICQVQVVPSGDLITTSWPLTDWMVPRSNESVWKPFLLWNVAVPSTPPRWRSRPSAHRTRAAGTAGEPAASVSAVFSWAPCALDDRAGRRGAAGGHHGQGDSASHEGSRPG